jgi:pyridoxine 5-phosphate synthase
VLTSIKILYETRGGNVLVKVATDIQKFGGQGITIHPRQMSATFAIKMLAI